MTALARIGVGDGGVVREWYGVRALLRHPPVVAPLLSDAAPVVCRYWNAAPLDGVSSMLACVAPGASESRNMRPALAQALVFDWLATYTVSVPSPVRDS